MIFFPLFDKPSHRELEESAKFGYACKLLSCSERSAFSIGSAYTWLLPAIQLDQIHFLFDEKGKAVAFATWAYLGERTLAGILEGSVTHLDIADWNEGINLFIVDFVSPFGHSRWLARSLCGVLGSNFVSAQFVRREAEGRIVRQGWWSKRVKSAPNTDQGGDA